jgi:peptidoglycan-N-acetylglucosamine deacetylase
MMGQVIVARGNRIDQMGVWLTFDDGPNPPITDALLNVLEEYNAKATFFVCGGYVKRHPVVVMNAFSQGHEIGNHTMSHQYLTLLSNNEIEKQLLLTSKMIRDVTGKDPVHFRAPYSKYNDRVIDVASNLGLKMVGWTKMGMDWEKRTATEISELVLSHGLSEKDIIVLHDGCADILANPDNNYYTGREETVIATIYILNNIRSTGLKIFEPIKRH